MKSLSLADMHCDTPFELFSRSQSFWNSDCAVSAEKANAYDSFIQVTAVWSDKNLDNDAAYSKTLNVIDRFKSDIDAHKNASFRIDDIDTKMRFILSIEDARILDNDITRLHTLYGKGVRIITPLWSGVTCIGGAFDTNVGLTDFGKSVIDTSAKLGIIPDISHASEKSAYDIFESADGRIPVIASHSDAYAVFPHKRNLTDELFGAVKSSGGLVGINLYTEHLGYDGTMPAIDRVISHIEHFLALGGEDTVCFGCDFDGAATPVELSDVSSLLKIAEKMSSLNYSNTLIEKIFYLNAENFIKKHIKINL